MMLIVNWLYKKLILLECKVILVMKYNKILNHNIVSQWRMQYLLVVLKKMLKNYKLNKQLLNLINYGMMNKVIQHFLNVNLLLVEHIKLEYI